MKDIFIIEGKKYISSRRASEMSDYSSDYVGQLCRANKLDCKMVGRTWFVTEESIHLHKASISREEASRNRIDNLKGKSEHSVLLKKDLIQSSSSNKLVNDSQIDLVENSPINNVVAKTSTIKVSEVIPAIPWTITTQAKTRIESNGIASPYIYSNDDRPLLPELKKKEVVEIKKQPSLKKEVARKVSIESIASPVTPKSEINPVTVITKNLSIEIVKVQPEIAKKEKVESVFENKIKAHTKHLVTYAELTRQIILQRVIAPALVLVVLFGLGTGTYIAADKIVTNIPNEVTDSAKLVTANIYDGLGSALLAMKDRYNSVVTFFTSPAKLALDIPKEFGEVTVSKVTPNGIVLSSSAGSEIGDDVLKDKIRGSFSDEVQISPDNSGTAGVITPVFKDTKGKDFIYVMVPVKDKDTNITP